jgi:hypothetical protein
LQTQGKLLYSGDKKVGAKIEGVKVEIYFATKEDWGAMLFYSTGPYWTKHRIKNSCKKNGNAAESVWIVQRWKTYCR